MSYFLPWWIIAPVALALSWWKAKDAAEAAVISAAAVVSLWVGYSLFLNLTSEVNLIDKIGNLLAGGGEGFISKIPKTGLIFTAITFIAGLIGSISGAAGVQIREYFK